MCFCIPEKQLIINRCKRCGGRKTVVGLGNMIKKCPDCNGIGHVKVEEDKNKKKKK